MKAVILARGLGTRMRRDDPAAPLSPEQSSLADAGVKAMIPVGRPFLDFVLSALADGGVRDICVVIGPEHHQVREYYASEVKLERVHLEFAVQEEPNGTAGAVLAARAFTRSDRFLVLNADNYYPVESYRALVELGRPGLPGFDREALIRSGNIDRTRMQRYALLRVNRDGFLEDIVEKPDDRTFEELGDKSLVSMNLWSFPPAIFDACEQITPSRRGELELPDAVRYAMRKLGVPFRVLPCALGVLDLSNRADIAAVADRLRAVEVRL